MKKRLKKIQIRSNIVTRRVKELLNNERILRVMDYLVSDLTKTLIEVMRAEDVACRLGVSVNTLYRWMRNESNPRPKQEALLRKLYGDIKLENDSLNKAVDDCLNQLREVFHKTSRFSSRNEALEEISKLFFAHITSIMSGNTGITREIITEKTKPAKCLRDFVNRQFSYYAKELIESEVQFELNIKESENVFAKEIIDIFEKHLGNKTLYPNTIGTDILNDIFGKFLSDSFVDEKQLGQYLTPQEIVSFAIELLFHDIQNNEISKQGYILDPSCGVGSFLTAYADKMYKILGEESSRKKKLSELMEKQMVGIDRSERMIKLTLINLAMFGYVQSNLFLHNALDFNEIDLADKVSVIMTNPPFGAEFSSKEVSSFKIVSEWPDKTPQKVNSEILFVEQYVNWLMPGGAAVCIIPDSILNNKGIYDTLRKGISKDICIKAIVSLPSNTFATTGTETKTSILYLTKQPYDESKETYMAVCKNVGYDVVSSGAHKTKKYNGRNDLFDILQDYIEHTENIGRWIVGLNDYDRWDAQYHATVPKKMQDIINENGFIQVKDVAELSTEHFNPKRLGEGVYFNYIEISDVDNKQLKAYGKMVLSSEAPSRARKLVHKGDILFSTVRPERGIVAVIDENQEGDVCTTGFAIIRPKKIDPMVLAMILQSEFVVKQIKKYAMGISYPVIDEKDLMDIYLPITGTVKDKYSEKVKRIKELERELEELRGEVRISITTDLIVV